MQTIGFGQIFDVLRGTCILQDAPTLHHYTDLDGLMGIFKTGELWATDIGFMNDTSEYEHANDMVVAELRSIGADVLPLSQPPLPRPNQEGITEFGGEWATRVGMTGVAERFLATSREGLLKPRLRSYVSCFCDSRNLLRQWRAYASGGYSIEFDGSQLASRFQGSDPPTLLARVEYSMDKQRDLIRSLLCNPPEFSPSKRFVFLKLSLRWLGAILRKLRIECASGEACQNMLGIIRLGAAFSKSEFSS